MAPRKNVLCAMKSLRNCPFFRPGQGGSDRWTWGVEGPEPDSCITRPLTPISLIFGDAVSTVVTHGLAMHKVPGSMKTIERESRLPK